MKMEQTKYFETLAYKIQTPGNCPEENLQHMGFWSEKLKETVHLEDLDVDGRILNEP
jgi:hypothetical protein